MSGGCVLATKDGYISVEEGATFQTLINPADPQEKIFITGFKDNRLKRCAFTALTFVLLGLPWLVLKWYPKLNWLTKSKISLKDADAVLIKNSNDAYSIHNVRFEKIKEENAQSGAAALRHFPELCGVIRWFHHHHVKYVWNPITGQFHALHGWDSGEKTVTQLLETSRGLTVAEEALLLQYYGQNKIEVEVKSHWHLFTSEVIHPFYLFQLFSIILWCVDEYFQYAICVLMTTIVSMCITLRTARKQLESLSQRVEATRMDSVHVQRPDGTSCLINANYLVPGDVIEVPSEGCTMPCDALLLNGLCIVNESTLTGESSPSTKTPPPPSGDKFDSFLFKRHTLYCGTQVLQTRYYGDHKVRAVVINTGYCTAKGELVRSILHPKPLDFQFYEDSLRFIAALFGLAALGMTYLITLHISRGVEFETILLDSLNLITVVVPPALPAAMTSGIVYAQSRLSGRGIFCTSPARINVAGKLKLFCFDKTGTLTEEGLDVEEAISVDKRKRGLRKVNLTVMSPHDHFAIAMASCHSLTRLAGRLSGDPLDLTIFNSINWDIEELGKDSNRYDMLCPMIVKPKWNLREIQIQKVKAVGRERTVSVPASEGSESTDTEIRKHRSGSLNPCTTELTAETVFDELPYEIGIVRHFPFSSASQSMSVITRCLGSENMVLYSKGAPEKIMDLCVPDSIPASVTEELKKRTSGGFRVIALASRVLDAKFTWRKSQKVRREEVETNLNFLGLVVLKNNLKPNTTSVIKELMCANIRCVMVTGDNLLTAISVSRECGMVQPEDMVVQVVVKMPSMGDGNPIVTYEPMGMSNESMNISNRHWHYAIDGHNFALIHMHLPHMLANIIVRGTVFARMLPEQKTQLIEAFQDLSYVVGMCGDGANDCGAMKTAHIGISLSESETSVAAPFTCTKRDLACVLYLMKEGRCALVTSFVIFKYMIMYSLIQFITVNILYQRGVILSTMEYLYIDLVITTLLTVVIGKTGPTEVLHKTRPLAKLFCASNLVPLVLEVAVVFIVLIASLYVLGIQTWFKPIVASNEEITASWENTVVYCVSCFQYLILALVYSQGKPHCQPFFKDFWFMLIWTFLCAFTIFQCVYPVKEIAEWFELVPTEEDDSSKAAFRFFLLLFPLANLALSFLIENAVAQRKWLKMVLHFILRKKKPKNRYKQVLTENLTWKPGWEVDSSC